VKRKILEAACVLACVLAPVSAWAAQVTVTDAWIRALPGNAAGYFTLRNDGATPIVLNGAASDGCGMIMLHKSESNGGMSSMADVAEVKLAPNETVKFEPGSYHLMCMNPKPSLKPGSEATVTLQFADKSHTAVRFAVKNAAGH
jgi:hypothetical protein